MHFTEPLRLEVGNEFNLNNVKEIKVTKQFLGLNMDIIGCQNVNSLSDCKTEQYRSTLKEQCHCSPLSLNPKEKVIKFDNINFRYISFYFEKRLDKKIIFNFHLFVFFALFSLFWLS